MTPTTQNKSLSGDWQNSRQLYPLYVAMTREFVIDVPPCDDLEVGAEAPPAESIELAKQWFLGVDEQIGVHQLRQFLQTTSLSNEESLRILLLHHLKKLKHSDSDRDKIDFLLVQFFSHRAPSPLADDAVTPQLVAEALEPALGKLELKELAWTKPLDELISSANQCSTLNTLFSSRILEKGREVKTSAGHNYSQPSALVAFTRFSFLMRRVFFRLMHQDLNAILDGLRELELKGVATVDCRKAQFTADEPIDRLRMICQSWKVMFHAEYSSGQPLTMLVDMRSAVDAALGKGKPVVPAKPVAIKPTAVKAAAAVAAKSVATKPAVAKPAAPVRSNAAAASAAPAAKK